MLLNIPVCLIRLSVNTNRRGMAFKVVVDLAQVEQLRLGEEADLGPGGVQHRRRVALQPHNKHTQSSI